MKQNVAVRFNGSGKVGDCVQGGAIWGGRGEVGGELNCIEIGLNFLTIGIRHS